MLGALVGDIVGSVFERAPHKSKEFDFISEKSRFTDDSVLTLATADAILHGYGYMEVFKYWGRCYPNAGYGDKFFRWCLSDLRREGTGRKLRQRLRDARLPRRVGLRHARRSPR